MRPLVVVFHQLGFWFDGETLHVVCIAPGAIGRPKQTHAERLVQIRRARVARRAVNGARNVRRPNT